MGVSTESQKQFAFVIASAIEGELVRLVDCAYLKLLAVEAKFADIVPGKDTRCLLLGVDSHPTSANREEYTSRTCLVLASS